MVGCLASRYYQDVKFFDFEQFSLLNKHFVADAVSRNAPSTCIGYNSKNVEGSASSPPPRTSKIDS